MKSRLSTFFLFLFSSSLFAQVFVNQDATGNNDGTTWDNAYTSLQDALSLSPDESEIWIAKGTYLAGDEGAPPDSTFFVVDKPLSLYGGFAGTETALDQRDLEANPTILSGDLAGDDVPGDFILSRGDNGIHVLLVDGTFFGDVIVDGFTIQGGAAKYGDPPAGGDGTPWLGGGILAFNDINVSNCIFQQNGGSSGSAMLTAGGAEVNIEECLFKENDSEGGTLFMVGHFTAQVKNCTFENNHAFTFGGAATVGNTNANFEDCIFLNNKATDAIAGGLFVFQNSGNQIPIPTVTVTGCAFSGNEAPVGGGFAMNNFYSSSVLIIDDNLFAENKATEFGAGALIQNLDGGVGPTDFALGISSCVFNGNEITGDGSGGALALACGIGDFEFGVETSTFDDNSATVGGGAIYLLNVASGRTNGNFDECSFEDNSSGFSGGAIDIFNLNPDYIPSYSFSDCSIEDNVAAGIGGGIYSSTSTVGTVPGSNLNIFDCLFDGNSAEGLAGGIFNAGSEIKIEDSFFAGNSTDAIVDGGGAITLLQNPSAQITRTIFLENASSTNGAAILHQGEGDGSLSIDNTLFAGHVGGNTVSSEDTLHFTNVTMADNMGGLELFSGAYFTTQNSIFSNNKSGNLSLLSDATAISNGANLSSDASMVDVFIGANGYDDFNETDPLLDGDLAPSMDSPCVDRGNPDGIDMASLDIIGGARFQGNNIDIGAVETPFFYSSSFEVQFKGTVSAFPIPFSNEINIEASEVPNKVRLFDTNGHLVTSVDGSQSKIFAGNDLPSGAYLLEWEFESGTARKLIFKK